MILGAALAVLAGCSSEEVLDGGNPNGQAEIKLQADVVRYIETKAAPTQEFAAKLLAIKSTASDYTTTEWLSDIDIAATTGTISFAEGQKKYYPSDGSTIKMKSIAPSLAAEKLTITSGIATYTITGQEDIMVSNEVSGTKTDKDNKELTFTPLLTKISFKAIRDASFAEDFNITGITIKQVPTKLDLNVSAGTIAAASPETKGDLTAGGTFSNISVATTANTTAANAIYLLPQATYELTITTDKFFPADGVTITIKPSTGGNFLATSSYTITLNFKGKDISGTADVTGRTETDESTDII